LSSCSRRRLIDEWDLELMTNLTNVTLFFDGACANRSAMELSVCVIE
jgi:hypothetical protein